MSSSSVLLSSSADDDGARLAGRPRVMLKSIARHHGPVTLPALAGETMDSPMCLEPVRRRPLK